MYLFPAIEKPPVFQSMVLAGMGASLRSRLSVLRLPRITYFPDSQYDSVSVEVPILRNDMLCNHITTLERGGMMVFVGVEVRKPK